MTQQQNPTLPMAFSLPNVYARLLDWLYLPPGHLTLIGRLTGLSGFLMGFIIFNYSYGGPGPYIIPPWRWHNHLLIVAMPPPIVTDTIFLAGALACVWLIFAPKRKWVLAIPLLIGAYFGCRDVWTIGSHFLVLTWTYLLALLLETKGRSVSRRLIQLSIFFCYFYSAGQKLLCPEFMQGHTLEAFMSTGWAFNDLWKPWLRLDHLPMLFWQAYAWITVLLEGYLAFALFSRKLRKSAFILGVLFHAGISILIDLYISLFSLSVFVGYLAFVDRKADDAVAAQPTPASNHWQLASAFALIAMMTLIPLRIYVFPERPLNTITMLDRTPWSFCMFLHKVETKAVQIRYENSGGLWHDFPIGPGWRTHCATMDNELYSIANFVFHRRPEAQAVSVRVDLRVNNRWNQVKRLDSTREHAGFVQATSEN